MFAFDPRRCAILLFGGDKTGRWQQWYVEMIPIADDLYDEHLETLRKGRLAMKTHPWSEIRDKIRADPERAAHIVEIRRGMQDVLRLEALRAQRGKTQQELATTLDVNQRTVSKIEHSENPYLETIREYVEALGGELHLTVVFPDETVELAMPSRQSALVDAG